jgi:hypothetical protein
MAGAFLFPAVVEKEERGKFDIEDWKTLLMFVISKK